MAVPIYPSPNAPAYAVVAGGRFGVDEGFAGACHGGRIAEELRGINELWPSQSSKTPELAVEKQQIDAEPAVVNAQAALAANESKVVAQTLSFSIQMPISLAEEQSHYD